MAEIFFSQSGAQFRIQDGGTHEMSAILENSTEDWDRCHRFLWRHKSGQGHEKCHATWILTVSCSPKQQRSVRQVIRIKTERLGSDCSLGRVLQSIMGR